LWKRTVLEICGDDEDYAAFMQRLAGYYLTGSTREEKLTFWSGSGGNGKGTIIHTLVHVMGDYATAIPITTLVQTRYQEHPTEIAKLFGVRLAVASETSDGARLDAAAVKVLTGGDRLTARFMRQDYFDFWPTHKIAILGNAPIILGRVDPAIVRRWLTLPFDRSFAEDLTLKDRLLKEAPGILAWAIEGCLEWQRDGLAPPKVVIDETEEYLNEQDDITQFIGERCATPAPELPITERHKAQIRARALYDEWREWCQASGVYAGTLKAFVERIKTKGFLYQNPHNVGTFYGITIQYGEGQGPKG
jgi:putative DNA primase/helicase